MILNTRLKLIEKFHVVFKTFKKRRFSSNRFKLFCYYDIWEKLFVISSSNNNNWGTENINSEKTELYSAFGSTILGTTTLDVTGTNINSVEAYATDDYIKYAFVNGSENTEQFYSEMMIGTSYDGINWQKNDFNDFLKKSS